MGIGLASLLAHDQVDEVTFASGNLRLAIAPSEWWTNRDYYSTWFERVETLKRPVPGFRISVRCQPELVAALKAALEPRNSLSTFSTNILDSISPAQGYTGILQITLDRKPVSTALPIWATFSETLITTTYQGSTLKIAYDSGVIRRSSVRWYGQLIAVKDSFQNFYFYLDVKDGRPINPLSPTRTGIIQDDAFKALLAFVQEQILEFVFDQKNREKITAEHVDSCYRLDPARSLAECPYITVRELLPLDNPSSFDEAQPEGQHIKVLTYDEAPLLLEEGLNLVRSATVKPFSYGLNSFIKIITTNHTLQNGDKDRLEIGELYWKPGPKTAEPYFHETGEFGISFTARQLPSVWSPIISDTPVFCFEETSNYDVEEVDFTVGTANPIAFLQNEAWCAFSASDDSDYDPQQEAFGNSIDALIRKLKGNCVPRHFSLYDLEQFTNDNEAVKQVVYRYHPDTFKKNGTIRTVPSAIGITLHTTTRRKINLDFY
jgi:hypothetical protein